MFDGNILYKLSGFWLKLQYKSGTTTTEAESGEVAVLVEGDTDDIDESSE